MKIREIIEMRDRRDAYERDYDSSISGMGRPHDHRGLSHELADERNNLAIAINGKTWKVIPGRGYADSREEREYLRHMQDWAAKKSASSGKKWSVHITGAEPTNESATPGATSTANVGTVVNPHHSPGKARGKKSYIGDPWGGKSGTKSPAQPKVVQPKNSDGTAKNGVESPNLFGAGTIKRR